MASIFTTPETQAAAKSFMHDVIVAAGLRNSQRQNSTRAFSYPSEIKAAQAICDELENRDFKNIDSSINGLAGIGFYATITGGSYKHFKAEQIAKAIVYMAELINVYWDDTTRTPYEIDEFKKTLLGTAVYKYGRYISAIQDPKAPKTRTSRASSTGTTSGTASAPSGKPVGPQSANVRDLRDATGAPGTPGAKVIAGGSVIFKIIGDKGAGKNTPNAFINPLNASGASGTTNKVKFSSGNGWTDCTCFFDDEKDAQDFLAKLLQNDPKAVAANAKVVKMAADPNGYFLVGTEYGICAISAKKLNEALTEAARLTEERGECWEKATKDYTKEELRELHDYMRRD